MKACDVEDVPKSWELLLKRDPIWLQETDSPVALFLWRWLKINEWRRDLLQGMLFPFPKARFKSTFRVSHVVLVGLRRWLVWVKVSSPSPDRGFAQYLPQSLSSNKMLYVWEAFNDERDLIQSFFELLGCWWLVEGGNRGTFFRQVFHLILPQLGLLVGLLLLFLVPAWLKALVVVLRCHMPYNLGTIIRRKFEKIYHPIEILALTLHLTPPFPICPLQFPICPLGLYRIKKC